MGVKFGRKTESNHFTYYGLDDLEVIYQGRVVRSTTEAQLITENSIEPDPTTKVSTTISVESPIQLIASNYGTNVLLGIFLPLILIALIVFMIIFWKRTIPIAKESAAKFESNSNIDVKFKKNDSQLFFDNNEKSPIIKDW